MRHSTTKVFLSLSLCTFFLFFSPSPSPFLSPFLFLAPFFFFFLGFGAASESRLLFALWSTLSFNLPSRETLFVVPCNSSLPPFHQTTSQAKVEATSDNNVKRKSNGGKDGNRNIGNGCELKQ